MKIIPTLLALSLTLGGCVASKFIVLKNPATGEIKECHTASGPSPYPGYQASLDNDATEACAKGYKAAGWTQMN